MDVNKNNDKVVQELDVYFSKDLSDNLFLLEYPTVSVDRMYSSDQRLEARFKPQHKKLEMDVMLDVSSPNYDQSKGEQIAINVDGRGGADKLTYENSVMDFLVLSSRCIPQRGKRYAAALIQDGQVHLTPISEVLQMTPSYKYMDQAEKRAAHSAKMKAQAESGNSSQDEVDDAKAVTVRVKGVDTEAARSNQEQSYASYEKRLLQEKWLMATVHSKDDPYSKKERNRLLGNQSLDPLDESNPDVQIGQESYFKTIVPDYMITDVDSGTNPDDVMSIAKLKTLSLGDQLKLLIKNAKIIHFSHLLTMLPSNPDPNSVVRSLQSYAVLVKGCWIVKSEVLYPPDTVSPISGTPSDIICKARDFILCLFTKEDFLVRSVVTKQVGIPWEEVKSILEDVAKMKVGHGWALKLSADEEFLAQYPEVHERQSMVWASRSKQLGKRFTTTESSDRSSKKTATSASHLPKKPKSSPNRSRKKSGSRKSVQKSDITIKTEMTEKELNGLRNFLTPPRPNSDIDSSVIVEHAVADINEDYAIQLNNESRISTAKCLATNEVSSNSSQLPMPFVKPSSVGITTEFDRDCSKFLESTIPVVNMEVDEQPFRLSEAQEINMENVHATVALVTDQMRQQALNKNELFKNSEPSS